jgi:hypothetical protein
MSGNDLFRFRRRKSHGTCKDDTEITVGFGIVTLVIVVLVGVLVARRVIPPDLVAWVLVKVKGS